MLMMEAKNRGKDEATIFNMMEKRLLKMKEAVETGVDDGSTGPSGISGGDTVKMHHYINQCKALSCGCISDAMTFSLATSESNARMGVIVATPTAMAARTTWN